MHVKHRFQDITITDRPVRDVCNVDLIVANLASDAYHSQSRPVLSSLKFLKNIRFNNVTFKNTTIASSKDGESCADIFVSYLTSVLVLVFKHKRLKLSLIFVPPTSPIKATNEGFY